MTDGQRISEKSGLEAANGKDNMVQGMETKTGSLCQRKRREIYEQPYGNLGELNTCRVLLDAVGEDLLFDVVNYFLDLLDTSVAVYERNGDYALGIFNSGWCRLLDQVSRNLCATDDNAEALRSGKWHCHESCWNASRLSMEKDQAVEIECRGGLRLFAVPIHARGKVIGSINFGCGNPPKSQQKFQEIADRYGIDVSILREQARSYRTQSPPAVDIAKRCLLISARLIGEIAERRLMEEDLRQIETRYREIAAGISVSEQKLARETGKNTNILAGQGYDGTVHSPGAAPSPGLSAGRHIHDFNNILASIMGYTEMILDVTSEESPAHPYLLETLKAIRRAKNLLGQVLSGARGDLCTNEAPCDYQGGRSREQEHPKINRHGSLPRGEESILLVDDEAPVAYIGQQMLAYLGYKVLPRTSSLDALETFRAEPEKFDLVILDQVMPHMNGTELARELMAIRPDIPIILCTGFHEEAAPHKVKALGIRDLVMKPIDMHEMAEIIRAVLVGSGMKSDRG